MHRTIETTRAGDETGRLRSTVAGVALLVCSASTSCATSGAASHIQPHDYGRVESITRTDDAGLKISFREMHENAFSTFDPALILDGDEIESALSAPSMPTRTFREWPRVLVQRHRLREDANAESGAAAQTSADVPVESVPSELWGLWSSPDPNALRPLRIAYSVDFVDPLNDSIRGMALLIVKEDPAGERRAIFVIEPPPSEPYVLLIGVTVDLLILLGVGALF